MKRKNVTISKKKLTLKLKLTLFRMGFFGAAHGWWGEHFCYTYATMIKLGSYTLPKEDPKNI